MIMFFRKLTETWGAKLLLLLIALSMGGLFGLGQMTSFWGAKTDAIRVGNRVVKPQELVRDVEQQARRMTSLTGQYVSIQTALTMGILPQTIANKVKAFLSADVAEDLGLVASSNAVGNYIVNNPNFQTITGTYDPSMIQVYLNRMQMSEQELTIALREELARKHFTDAAAAVIRVPEFEQDTIYSYKSERRDFETILLPAAFVEIKGKPDEKTLKNYYEAMEENLYTPEYRQINVLRLTPDELAKSIAVSEDEVKAVYEARQNIYATPEKRKVEQILVKDSETAQALYEELTAENFKQVAKEKANQEDIDLGWIEKTGVVESVGEAVFNAESGKVLPPVESQFGFHILIVREVEKAKQTPFSDVKADIKANIQAERAYDILLEKSKTLDNALGEGASLADAAKLINLQANDIVWVDVSGLKDDGKTSMNLPTELTQKIFMMKKGDVSPLYDFENGYIVAQVLDVKASALKPFDAVKDELVAEWKKDQQTKNAADFAQKVFESAQKDFSKTAKTYHLETQDLKDVRREDIKGVSAADVKALFDAKQGDVLLLSAGQNDYILAKVKAIASSDEQQDVVEKQLFNAGLSEQVIDSVYTEVLSYYGQKNKVKVNEALIEDTFAPYRTSQD